ncbi:glycosyltransferase family 2 protein [Olleya namhaensis]|uniref:glycosyltransferase family 2 protein n=1 Tax=Olleya namhaensis TaxID=1144750 RepID=UPI002490FE08|nr:glycosyltransferase family A protein [Olleya namhaensis]
MLILVHNNGFVNSILDEGLKPISIVEVGHSVTKTLQLIAANNSETLVVWCHQMILSHLDINALDDIFHHRRVFASFNPTDTEYLPKQLGYVERSFAVNINKTVTYPTWLMSSYVGGINTAVIKKLGNNIKTNQCLDYYLTSIAKLGTTEGLFCYSEPKLLKTRRPEITACKTASTAVLFKFVRQHYKWVWVFFLSFGYLVFEKRITLFLLIKSFFIKQLKLSFDLERIPITSTKTLLKEKTIDVIIPTIGRKQYLYDVLKDLSVQSILPKTVIIVEQNSLEGSISELNYIHDYKWPFAIKHTFTHQSGVCNARNIALQQVESEWVFFADDDIRFNTNFFQDSFSEIAKYGASVLNYLCLQPQQKQTYFKTHQTSVFGSGSSMVKTTALNGLRFNLSYEFGFGEDTEFGMQLRNKGNDIIFMPNIKITHLKAPIGGYRTKVKQLWDNDSIGPRPSPTMMLLNQTYFTKTQLLGYKMFLAIRGYKSSASKKPKRYMKNFRKHWERSLFWSNKL